MEHLCAGITWNDSKDTFVLSFMIKPLMNFEHVPAYSKGIKGDFICIIVLF